MMQHVGYAGDGDVSIRKGALKAFLAVAKHMTETISGAVASGPEFTKKDRGVIQIQSDCDEIEEVEDEPAHVTAKQTEAALS